jgi:hypothetical protein
VTVYHLIKSSPLDLERVETRNKWSLRMACGRLEATEMWVLPCHSLVRHGQVIPNITFTDPSWAGNSKYYIQSHHLELVDVHLI